MMTKGRKIIIGYLMAPGAIFLAGYFLFGIRESRLHLLMMAINLPASLVIVPGMEEASLALGWVLGGPAHVWATELASLAVNGALLGSLLRIARRL